MRKKEVYSIKEIINTFLVQTVWITSWSLALRWVILKGDVQIMQFITSTAKTALNKMKTDGTLEDITEKIKNGIKK